MDGNAKAPHGRNAGLQDRRAIRAEQSQQKYNDSAEFIQDCQQFEREAQHFLSVTPEPRVCVYRIASSVPLTNAKALRLKGWL